MSVYAERYLCKKLKTLLSNLFRFVDALAKISDNTTFPKLSFMRFWGFSEISVDVGSG